MSDEIKHCYCCGTSGYKNPMTVELPFSGEVIYLCYECQSALDTHVKQWVEEEKSV